MANLPEYESKVKIQPAPIAGSASDALSSLGAAHQGIGQIGANIALDSAISMAQTSAIEQATYNVENNRARELFPGITASTKAFNEAYQSQEYMLVANNANRFLNQLYSNTQKNPGKDSLLQFEEIANEGIDGLLKNVTQGTRRKLEPYLRAQYDAAKIKLDQQVFTKLQAENTASFNKFVDTTVKQIQDLVVSGDDTKAAGLISSLNAMLREKTTMDLYGLTDNDINNIKELFTKSFKDAVYARDADTLSKTPGALEKYLQELADAPPTVENLREAQVMLETYNRKRSLKSAQEELDLIKAAKKRETGTFGVDDLLDLERKVSANAFAKFELDTIRYNARRDKSEIEFQQLMTQMVGDLGSRERMLNYTSGEKDKVFTRLVELDKAQTQASGEEYTSPLLRQAQIAQAFNAPVERFQRNLETAIKYGSPQEIKEAGMAIKALSKNRKIALDGFDKDAKAVSDLFNAYRLDAGKSEEDAAKEARNDVYGIDEDTKAHRLAELKDILRDKTLNNEINFTKFVAKELGATEGWIFKDHHTWPAGLTNKVKTLLPSYYVRYGRFDLAKDALFSDLKQVYSKTNINDDPKGEIMANAPQRFIDDDVFLQNDKVRAFSEYVGNLKTLNQNNLLQKVEMLENYSFEDMLSKRLTNELRAKVNGVERKIVVKSDDVTQLSPSLQLSYRFFYLDDNGIPQPLLDPTQPASQARWYLDFDLYENQIKGLGERYKERQHKMALEQKAAQLKQIEEGIGNTKSPYWWIDG